MKCSEFIDLVDGFLVGNLDEERLRAFKEHLSACARCEELFLKEFEAHNRVINALEELPESSPALSNLVGKVAAAVSEGMKGKALLERTDKAFEGFRKDITKEIPKEELRAFQEMQAQADQKPIAKRSAKAHIERPVKKETLIERLIGLSTALRFNFAVAPLSTRSGGRQGKNFNIGESIDLKFDPPRKMDGYLTVFQYDEKYNLKIVFPRNKDDILFVGKDEKRGLLLAATGPKGKHYLKAVLTPRQVIDSETIKSSADILYLTEEVLSSIKRLRDGEWMEAVAEFEVV